MKEGEMYRIYIPLIRLKVITLMEYLGNVKMIRRRVEKFIVRKQRRLTWPHIGEDYFSGFFAGISGMANGIPMLAAARLAGLFETTPVNIVEPTVVEAT